ncbi:MAG: TonB-dependent receptor [Acidobacteriota bacterium]
MSRRMLATRSVVIAVLLLSLWLSSTPLPAQSPAATLQGTVTDATGAVVPNAAITLVNEATNVRQTTQSNQKGDYYFSHLPPGPYKLSVEVAGFRAFVRSGIQLQVQQQATADVVLTPGDVTTRVEVTGEAPRLEAVNATLGRVVENKSLLDLPLKGRDILAFAALTPGIIGSPAGESTGTNWISNGVRNAQSDILTDGVSTTIQTAYGGATTAALHPSPDAVQEFKVQTNSFGAEFGFTGGTVVNLVTRSGTNDLHGSLYEFHRNSALNANNWFANRAGRKLVPWRRNNFGGTAGGPVLIPNVYKGRDRTFFFFQHEGAKQTSPRTTTMTVPTTLQKQGDFSQTFQADGRLITIYDPFSARRDPQTGNWVRDAFVGNVIPQARMNRVGLNLMKYYPNPNAAPGNPYTQVNNFAYSGSAVYNSYQTTIKIDHNFSETKRLSARYTRFGSSSENPNAWGKGNPMYAATNKGYGIPTHNAFLDYTQTINPTTVLSLRSGVSRHVERVSLFADVGDFDVQSLGFQAPLQLEIPPLFNVAGYPQLGQSRWNKMVSGDSIVHFIAHLDKVTGRHTLKFGGEARLPRFNHRQPGINSAELYLEGRQTARDPLRSDSYQGSALASLLLGWGSQGSYNTDAATAMEVQSYSFFFQDDLKLTRRLTLNLGLRYELPVAETERYNRLSWFDPLVKSPLSVPQFPDLRGGMRFADKDNRRAYDTDKNNLAPRFSFAYQFAPKFVARGGYGIYYGITRGQFSGLPGQGFATSTNWLPSLDGGVTQYASLSNPFPDGFNRPLGNSLGLLTSVGSLMVSPLRDWGTTPYYQQWSFSIQRELPASSVFELAYSGSHGVHLGYGQNSDINRMDQKNWSLGNALYETVDNPFYGVITDPTSALSKPKVTRIQLLRPYPQFTRAVGYPAPPNANSIYHGGQLKFTKRYSRGLSSSAHYTFSKMIDDNSSSHGGLSWIGGAGPIQSWGNLRLERAVSLFDVTHRLVADFTYELPIGRGKGVGGSWARWMDLTLGGWQVNGILEFASGFPLFPRLSADNGPEFGHAQRPNLLFDPKLPGSVKDRMNRYLNAPAFSQPADNVPGNAPRTISSVRMPTRKNFDASLFKNFYLDRDKGRYLQLRAEAYNVTNTPILGGPNVTWGSPSFGVISGQANSPREIQFGAKIYF